MQITSDMVKELREQTGISVMQCKAALEEAGGDKTKALEILAKKGAAISAKKGDRTLGAGTIASYIHANKQIGTMVMLRSETDFVSKNEEFVALAKDIALHIAASEAEDVAALLTEPYVKDDSKTIQVLIESAVQKFGERIEIEKFVRYSMK